MISYFINQSLYQFHFFFKIMVFFGDSLSLLMKYLVSKSFQAMQLHYWMILMKTR